MPESVIRTTDEGIDRARATVYDGRVANSCATERGPRAPLARPERVIRRAS
jgi:hypothetical protein